MLSVVIPTRNHERALVPTLASLVPGAANGLVRDVTVVDAGSTDATLEVADLAGCRVVGGPAAIGSRLDAGARQSKGPWLLFLEPGVVLEESWRHEVRSVVDALERAGRAGDRAAVFRFGLDGFDGRSRTVERLAVLSQLLTGLSKPEQGLLIRSDFYHRAGGFGALPAMAQADLLRRIGQRRLIRLRSKAIAPALRPAAEPGRSGPKAALGAGLLMLRVPPRVVARLYG